ncbi:MAG: PilZ domain-containing protein [Nitrospinaceae bacterium]
MKKNRKGSLFNKLFTPPQDNRGSFRVSPSSVNPVEFTVAGKPVQVLDISSGGVSFRNVDFQPGRVYPVKLILPSGPTEIAGRVEILEKDDDSCCHCCFRGMAPGEQDRIHLYVLNRQKEELEERKKNSPDSSPEPGAVNPLGPSQPES